MEGLPVYACGISMVRDGRAQSLGEAETRRVSETVSSSSRFRLRRLSIPRSCFAGNCQSFRDFVLTIVDAAFRFQRCYFYASDICTLKLQVELPACGNPHSHFVESAC